MEFPGLEERKKEKEAKEDARLAALTSESAQHDKADAHNGWKARIRQEEAAANIAEAERLVALQRGFVNVDDMLEVERLKIEARTKIDDAVVFKRTSDAEFASRVKLSSEIADLELKKMWRKK